MTKPVGTGSLAMASPRFARQTAAPESRAGSLPRGMQLSKLSNHRQHKGEPRLPFNMSLRALFLLLKGGLLLFLELALLLRFCATPIRGQEQTYFFER